MKYIWIKTVNGDKYRSYTGGLDEEEVTDVVRLLSNLAKLTYLAAVNPTIFTRDGNVEEVVGTVFINPNNIVHAFLSDK